MTQRTEADAKLLILESLEERRCAETNAEAMARERLEKEKITSNLLAKEQEAGSRDSAEKNATIETENALIKAGQTHDCGRARSEGESDGTIVGCRPAEQRIQERIEAQNEAAQLFASEDGA